MFRRVWYWGAATGQKYKLIGCIRVGHPVTSNYDFVPKYIPHQRHLCNIHKRGREGITGGHS